MENFMKQLTHALPLGAPCLGFTAGAYADDVTIADKKQADANYEAAVEKAKAEGQRARANAKARLKART
jgi:hypothetical protein